MDTTDIPMLTMARGLLMLNPRLMLILTFSMVDTTDLDTMALAMDIPMLVTPTTDKLSTKEKEVPAAKETIAIQIFFRSENQFQCLNL